MIRSLLNKARAFVLRPDDGRALFALRVTIGLAMLTEALLVFGSLEELYGPYGFLQADLIEALTGRAIPGVLQGLGISLATYSVLLKMFYAFHIVCALGFTLGSRAANVGLWLTQAAILSLGYYSSYGVDRYFLNFVFMLIFITPVTRANAHERRREWAIGTRLLQLFLLMTYMDAGFSKSLGSDWWNGEAIWRVLNQPEFRRFDFLWLQNFPWISLVLGWATVVIEAGYFLGYLIKPLRKFWVLAIIGLHLGIALGMSGLTLFGVSLAAANFALMLVPELSPGVFRVRLPARNKPVWEPAKVSNF